MDAEISRLEQELQACRTRLLEARRRRPPQPVKDYALTRPDATRVQLSALFAGKPDLLLVHNMGRKCPYCTLWADGLNGFATHLQSRAGFVLASPDDPATLAEFAASRGWRFPIVSTKGSTLPRDLGFERGAGDVLPGVSALRRRPDGSIERTSSASFGPGDLYCAIWHLFDLLEDGANGWEPKYVYPGS